ncbi:GH3 auxin-responsive promoter family protein [Halotia branconii]|uniref:GH3 auxin-responsive promoter family protein n=1 Tax=Halotia branconii CENA392 TaxID=1539056 RepID=A0AAJ6P9J9_9CYAN|nr:GH3 auxin-responsive promoter family protein [Halotia branconii]WGV25811.1 GH3 auxin-responsive promoter family protein [Halotia branconii CENA392]
MKHSILNSNILQQARQKIQKIQNISFLYLSQMSAKMSLKSLQKDTINAEKVQTKLLKDILQLQKDTEYGNKYNFVKINSVEKFQELHPLTSYEDYYNLIEDIANTGNYSRLLAEPILFFQETSGTTGKAKLIPRTQRLSLTFQKSFQSVNAIITNYYCQTKSISIENNRGLALASTQPLKTTPSGIPRGTGTSGGIRQSKLFQKVVDLNFSSPATVFFIPNYKTAYYCHLLFALLEPNLTYITANFASNVLESLQILEREWTQIVDDISAGKINSELEIDSVIREELESGLKPSPEKSQKLKAEFEKGFEGIINRIWTHLSYIQCVTTGSMELYKEKLKFYAGSIPIYSGGYGASEAWIGCNLEPHRDATAYVVNPNSAFFEFIPSAEIELAQPQTIRLTSLEINESYEVVVTTVAGLYRYRMGDIVKCVGYYNRSPILEFSHRQGSLLNISGEKVSETEILEAITQSIKIWGGDRKLVDYTTNINLSFYPLRYSIYLEVSPTFETLPDLIGFQNKFEEVLYDLNVLYLNSRQADSIAIPEIKLVKTDTFIKLKSKIISQGGSETQFKMPRLLKNLELVSFLDSNCLE